MKRMRTLVGLCVVALAVSLIGVVDASAEPGPERGLCTAKVGGKFKDVHCEEEGGTSKGQEFEWVPQGAVTHSFTSTSGPDTIKSFTSEGAELPALECKKSKGKGKTGTTTSTAVIDFEECTSGGEKCGGGPNAKPGEIITFELEGTLGLINDASEADVVGEDLAGKVTATNPEGLISEFKCENNELKRRGSVIGHLTPVATKATTFTLAFQATGSKQEPESFEGGLKDTLETEDDGIGGGMFPFTTTEVRTETIKGAATEVRA